MRRSRFISLSLVLFAGLMSSSVFAQEHDQERHGGRNGHHQSRESLAVVDLLDRPAVPTRAAAHSVLIDIIRIGSRLVAVGERGIVVLSDDGGRNWKQASVPTSVSLTAVQFVNPKTGWVVGHSGVVLKTEDAGETWTRQLDGKALAKLAIEYAQTLVSAGGAKKDAADKLLAEAQRLESDGPDKPFLRLYFENENTGFVVGAYGLTFKTEDGGKTWKPWMDRVDNPRGMHIYAIAAAGDSIYMAGEQGLFLRSTDKGNKFTRVETPYKGTYFNMAVLPTGEIIIGGMKGNAFRSTDQGKSFKPVVVPVPVSFSAVTTLQDGTLVFANQAGMLLASKDKGQSIIPLSTQGLPPISGVADAGNGMLMTVGFAGAIPVPLNAAGAAPSTGGAQ